MGCRPCTLAMGFLGPEHSATDLVGIEYDERSNYKTKNKSYHTNLEGIFAAVTAEEDNLFWLFEHELKDVKRRERLDFFFNRLSELP